MGCGMKRIVLANIIALLILVFAILLISCGKISKVRYELENVLALTKENVNSERDASHVNSQGGWAGIVSEQCIPPPSPDDFEWLNYDQMRACEDQYFSNEYFHGEKSSSGQDMLFPEAILIPLERNYDVEDFGTAIVRLDAILSHDDRGQQVGEYWWDLNEDGLFETSSTESTQEISISLSVQKIFKYSVKVYDDNGGYDCAGTVISVGQGWPNLNYVSWDWYEPNNGPCSAFVWYDAPNGGALGWPNQTPIIGLALPKQSGPLGSYDLKWLATSKYTLESGINHLKGCFGPVKIDYGAYGGPNWWAMGGPFCLYFEGEADPLDPSYT